MVSEQDFDRLSAYIDRELPPDEQAALEERLQREPDLRRELDELRIIVQAVRGLPEIQAPRAFTLTPEMVGTAEPPSPSRFLVFPATGLVSALSSVAAALLLIAGGLLLFVSGGATGNVAYAPEAVAVQPTLAIQQQELAAATVRPTRTPQTTATPTPQIAATMPAALDDDAGADEGDMDMAQAEEAEAEEMEVFEAEADEAMAESAEEAADMLFDDDTTATDEVGRSIAGDTPQGFGAAGAMLEESEAVQLTVPPSPMPTQQPTLTSTPPPATATAIAQPPPSDREPPARERQLPAISPTWIAVLLLALGGLSAVVAVGTAVQRRRNRGRA